MTYQLIHGDCLDIDWPQVDAIITDVPYETTAAKWDSIIPFPEMWKKIKSVLKPRGVFLTTASVFQPFAVWFSDLTLSAVGNKVQIYASPVQPQLNVEEVAGGTSAALAIDTAGSIMISGFYFVD